MNWTEGALARHLRGKGLKPEISKQKQYFAKTRPGPRDASKPTASIPFLSRPSSLPKALPEKQSPRALIQSSPYFQRRQSQQVEAQERHSGHSLHQRLRDDGLSTANRDFLKSHMSNGKRRHTTGREETLDTKRRRLLQKGDWAGINVQKPMPLQFSARGNSAGGQIWGYRNKHRAGQPASFFEKLKHSRKNALRGHGTSHSSTQGGDRVVRIRIGSEDVRFGGGSQATTRSSHQNSPRTVTQSKGLQQSIYFMGSSSPHHHAFSGSTEDRERTIQTKKSTWQIRRGRDGATYDDIASRASQSMLHGQQGRLENDQRAGQPLVVESSPVVVHHPVPQRLSQLVLSTRRGTPKSDAFGSTVAEVSYNPLPAVDPSELSENERWHDMLASSGHREETPKDLGHSRAVATENISPGASNFPGPSSPSAHQPSSGYSTIRASLNVQTRTPSGFEMTHAGTWPNNHEPYEELGNGGSLPRHTPVALRFSSPLSLVNTSPSLDNSAVNDLEHGISTSQGKTHTTEEAVLRNLCGNTMQRPSLLTHSDNREEHGFGQQDREAHPRDDVKEADALGFVFKTSEIKTNRNTSDSEPAAACVDADWMNFIFGERDEEAQDTLFREARQEAARDLRPSSSSSSSHCPNLWPPSLDHDTETVATCGTFDRENDKDIIRPSSRRSFVFDLDPPDESIYEDLTSSLPETRSVDITHADIEESAIDNIHDLMIPGTTGSNYTIADIDSAPAMDSMSTVAQPPESEVGETPGQYFRFARPKTFVGRLGSSSVHDAGPILPLSIHPETKKRGRPKRRSRKKAKDGRANIRRMPDHDGDPIEGDSDE